MRPNPLDRVVPPLLFVLALALPTPAFALRQPNPKDSPPLEQGLAAGLEEGQYERASLDEVPGMEERLRSARRLEDYRERLVRRGGRYYLAKSLAEPRPEDHRAVWPTIHSSVRDYLGFLIARRLGCNVCDVVIPSLEERRRLESLLGGTVQARHLYLVELSTNYSVGDPQVLQDEPSREFTRRLLTALFIRFWDMHENNTGPIKGSTAIRMMFDPDQSFHPKLEDPATFVLEFVANYFSLVSEVSGHVSTVEQAERDKGIFRIDPLELFDPINEEEFKAAYLAIRELDLVDLEREARQFLVLDRYAQEDWTAADTQIKTIFQRLRKWQASFHTDLRAFLSALANGGSFSGREILTYSGDLSGAKHLGERYFGLQQLIGEASLEFSRRKKARIAGPPGSQAGLEELVLQRADLITGLPITFPEFFDELVRISEYGTGPRLVTTYVGRLQRLLDPRQWVFFSQRHRDYTERLSRMRLEELRQEASRLHGAGWGEKIEALLGGFTTALGLDNRELEHYLNAPFAQMTFARDLLEMAGSDGQILGKAQELLFSAEQARALLAEFLYRWDNVAKPRSHALFDGKLVVVDSAWIQQEPRLGALLDRLDQVPAYAGRVIVLGTVPGKGWASIRTTEGPADLQEILEGWAEGQPFFTISFLGPADVAPLIRAILLDYPQAGFDTPVPTPARALLAMLRGLSVPADLSEELLTGLEEADLFAEQA